MFVPFAPFHESELAMERHRLDPTVPGVHIKTRETPFPLTELLINSEEGARGMGRPCGRYITVTYPPLFSLSRKEEATGISLLSRILHRLLPREGAILVVGLGNRNLTADAVGPQVVERLCPLEAERPLYILTPQVEAQSGMESARVVGGVVDAVKPSAVLAIDALVARGMERLCRTIQITDTGIVPGSGICRQKAGLTRESLGIPVIAVGIPTMMHIGGAMLELLGTDENSIPTPLRERLTESREYVLPEGIDLALENAAFLLSRAIQGLPSCSNPETACIE